MALHIEISERDAIELLDFYTNKRKAIVEQMQQLEEDNRSIEDKIRRISSLLDFGGANEYIEPVSYPQGYSDKMVWLDKIRFILKQAGKGLTTTEIIDSLIKLEPKYRNDRQTAVRSISATASAKAKDGKLGKTENERKEFVYFLTNEEDKQENSEQLDTTKNEQPIDDIF